MTAEMASQGGRTVGSLRNKKNSNGRRRNHAVSERDKPARRFRRFLRVAVPVLLVVALIYGAIVSPVVMNIISIALTFAVQIAFILSLAILQFVGIFWFMA